MFWSLAVEGLAVGSIYSLVAIGFIMLFKTSGSINFAHGDQMMFSTFIAYTLLGRLHLPYYAMVVLTLLFAVLTGILVERVIVRPIISKSPIAVIIATLGLASILQGVASLVWRDFVFPFPPTFPGEPLRVGTVAITPQSLGILVSTMVIISLLFVFLNYTKMGTGLRAVTQNPVAAKLMGIRLGRMYSLAWGVAGALSALAGILLAPRLFLSTKMGSITFMAIAATVIGGWGNLFGAVVGGYLLGFMQTVLPMFIPTKLQSIIPFALLLFVLILRPTGITGTRRVTKA